MSSVSASRAPGVLVLDKVWRSYHLKQETLDVLRGIELSLCEGEAVALISPSGTGKSTLLHSAGLLERPDKGEINILGHPTAHLGDKGLTALRRHYVGFVYQFHHLMPELSAWRNVALPQIIAGRSPGEAKTRALALLDMLELGPRSHHRPSELSGGEQQRVALARAVANRPKLLLADEPTGNLDPATSDLVFSALEHIIAEEGLAALIATHNHALAARLPRRVMIENGLLVELA